MRNLVICCDGTWARADQSAPTNVAKLALAVAPTDAAGSRQPLLYQSGVGTRKRERVLGGTLGAGLGRNVREAYRFVVDTYEPGDRLFLFGFSRGAYTARSLGGMLGNCGILAPEHRARVDEAYALYRSNDPDRAPAGREARLFRRSFADPSFAGVHCIGVWDTVGSLGVPIQLPGTRRLYGFHDVKLSRSVTWAFQALAIQEQRRMFVPTLWELQPGARPEQHVEQTWFTGVHSDVGGGYPEAGLADLALAWMQAAATRAGLAFDPAHLVAHDVGTAFDPVARADGLVVCPDPRGELHESYRGAWRILGRRRRTHDAADDHESVGRRTATPRTDDVSDVRPEASLQ